MIEPPPKPDEELVRDAALCLGPDSRFARIVCMVDAARAAGRKVVVRLQPLSIEISDND